MPNIGDLALFLLTLKEAGGAIKGRTRIQKSVCILRYRDKIPFSFEFRPYYYGPYSDQLAEALETLRASNVIQENQELFSDNVVQYQYKLTAHGDKLCKKLLETQGGKLLAKKIREGLNSIKELQTQDLVDISKKFHPAYNK